MVEVLKGKKNKKERERNKNYTVWKGRLKLSQFANDTNSKLKNPKESTKTLLGLRNELSKFGRYKLNIQKSTVFFMLAMNVDNKSIK